MTSSDQLTPCPDAPHCVSSQAPTDSAHYIAPLSFSGDSDTARTAFLNAIAASKNATVEKSSDGFIHATFKSTLGFVDDVTAVIRVDVQTDKQYIDIKSSSRLGYYDFGVNRKRVEKIRQRFNQEINGS